MSKLSVPDYMRAFLAECLDGKLVPDASDLALHAKAEGYPEDLTPLRSIGSDVLNEAGYCECSCKFVAGAKRCPACGRRQSKPSSK